MKKIFLLLLTFITTALNSYAQPTLEGQLEKNQWVDVGISKYAVLEITRNYAPLRYAPDENAQRATHLNKGVIVYADKKNDKFFKIDLGLNKPLWIEKKYVEVQGIIPEKIIPNVERISFRDRDGFYFIIIPAQLQTAFSAIETSNGLDFSLYDVNFDRQKADIKNKIGSFNISSDKNILNISYNSSKPLIGYDILNTDNATILKIRKFPKKINPKKPLKGIKVAIDPGHGGEELGVSTDNLDEKTINLQISKKLRREFKKRGAKVVMTRKKDKYVDLYERINLAKEKDAMLLVSVHQNSLANLADVYKKHGTGVYYYNKQARALAYNIQKEMLEGTKFPDDGVNYASFALTRPTNPVSVLVECGYLIHPQEAKKLSDKKFQRVVAKSIVKGTENYLKALN